ncbi:Demethylmenaquinone methyltransferase [bioreactor metagenome]|uniref:Demethylmenaquinone methyltransferase n=1 Tax=bioreactor metagenome TaxID=1076179 RepID=A0A645EBE1_9ZZZZ
MTDNIHNHEGTERQKNGITSIDRLDVNLVFDALKLKKGDVFADIGCGAGDYSFKASELVGSSGLVYALDQWKEIEDRINIKASESKIKNIKAITSDLKFLPFNDNSCDFCFISMVLHGFDLSKHGESLFKEFHRILKPRGKLAIIEIKKEETLNYSDYKQVGSLLMPFRIESSSPKKDSDYVISIYKIDTNKVFPANIFKF